MEKRELICVTCPVGCVLTVEMEKGEVVNVKGNSCPRGKIYAENEIKSPKRTLTTTLRCMDGSIIAVKSNEPIDKNKLFLAMDIINEFRLENRSVKRGDIIIKNILDTGVNIVATSEKL